MFELRTADELLALDQRWSIRREARQKRLCRRVLRLFLDRGGPIPVAEVVAASDEGSPEAVHEALVALDDDDLIRIRAGLIDIAYPFSAMPGAFAVAVASGERRYACCAVDALGVASMIGRRVEIFSRCHHCGTPLEFSATPHGPGPGAEGVMLWIGKRPEEGCKVVDSL
jgi:hypothetical protein